MLKVTVVHFSIPKHWPLAKHFPTTCTDQSLFVVLIILFCAFLLTFSSHTSICVLINCLRVNDFVILYYPKNSCWRNKREMRKKQTARTAVTTFCAANRI